MLDIAVRQQGKYYDSKVLLNEICIDFQRQISPSLLHSFHGKPQCGKREV